MLTLNNIHKTYYHRWTKRSLVKSLVRRSFRTEERQVLSGVSFVASPGECIGLVGANGAGKSTLLRIIADVIHPSEGEVLRSGSITPLLSAGAFYHPILDVAENIRIAGVFYGASTDEDTILEICKEVNLSEHRLHPLSSVSHGSLFKLTLAIGLRAQSSLYLIDELFDPLDTPSREVFITYLQKHLSRGASCIFTTHDHSLREKLATRQIEL